MNNTHVHIPYIQRYPPKKVTNLPVRFGAANFQREKMPLKNDSSSISKTDVVMFYHLKGEYKKKLTK